MDLGNTTVDALSECVLRAIEYFKPDLTVGLGDLLEGAAFSRHAPRSAEKAKGTGFVEDELEPSRAFLDRIQAASAETHLILGNHEQRVSRWCAEQHLSAGDLSVLMPEHFLARTSGDRVRKRFSLTRYVGPNPHYLIAPNLVAVHGMSYSAQAARQHLDIFRNMNVVFGHVHSAMYYSTRHPITQATLEAWSPGCICSRTPDYKAHEPSRWAWGCTVIYQSRTRPEDWTALPVKFLELDGAVRTIMPDGKAISVKVR